MLTVNKDFLQDTPISPEQVSETILSSSKPNIGAHSIFLGQVREDTIDGKKVTEIEYSAYDEMVANEMEKVVNIVVDKYADIKRIYIKHAKGIVKVGEISLLVFIACGHRVQAFRAVAETVNLIKERVPIWKKEFLEDNSHTWPENK
jgi:molybdopterin synthase catalytic subunit